jgi:hypothetical protein
VQLGGYLMTEKEMPNDAYGALVYLKGRFKELLEEEET